MISFVSSIQHTFRIASCFKVFMIEPLEMHGYHLRLMLLISFYEKKYKENQSFPLYFNE